MNEQTRAQMNACSVRSFYSAFFWGDTVACGKGHGTPELRSSLRIFCVVSATCLIFLRLNFLTCERVTANYFNNLLCKLSTYKILLPRIQGVVSKLNFFTTNVSVSVLI